MPAGWPKGPSAYYLPDDESDRRAEELDRAFGADGKPPLGFFIHKGHNPLSRQKQRDNGGDSCSGAKKVMADVYIYSSFVS